MKAFTKPTIEITPASIPVGDGIVEAKVILGNDPLEKKDDGSVFIYGIDINHQNGTVPGVGMKPPDSRYEAICKDKKCHVDERKDNRERVPKKVTVEQPSDEDNTIIFKIDISGEQAYQYYVALYEGGLSPSIPEGIGQSRSFSIVPATTNTLSMTLSTTEEPTGDQVKFDTQESRNKKIYVFINNPDVSDFIVQLPYEAYRYNPNDPKVKKEVSCTISTLCTTSITLPDGLTPGEYAINLYEKKDFDKIDTRKTRATASFIVDGDPTKRPGLFNTCADPSQCTKATPNLCDITKGTKLDPNFKDPFKNPKEVSDYINNENVGFMTAIGCIPTHPVKLIDGFLKFFAAAAGGIALLMMIYGSFQMITSQGDANAIKQGREQFTAAVVGILFVIFSVAILQIIGVDILSLPGFLSTKNSP